MSEHRASIDALAFLNGLASEIERLRSKMRDEDGFKALATASSIQSLDAVFNALRSAYRPAPGRKLEVLTGQKLLHEALKNSDAGDRTADTKTETVS